MTTSVRILLIVLLSLPFASPALWLPSLWPAFVVPALVSGVLQFVATGPWARKERLFKFTDYVYYLIIGGVVVAGSQYVLRANQVSSLNSELEEATLNDTVTHARVDLPALAEELASTKQALVDTPAAFVAECLARQLTDRMRRNSENAKAQVPRIDPCLGYMALAGRETQLTKDIATLQQTLALSERRLAAIFQSKRAADPPIASVSLIPDLNQRKLEFMWVPMFVFIGIAIKLGKTTCSLLPSKP